MEIEDEYTSDDKNKPQREPPHFRRAADVTERDRTVSVDAELSLLSHLDIVWQRDCDERCVIALLMLHRNAFEEVSL